MLSVHVMLSFFMLWMAPRLRDVGFNWSGFMGGMVTLNGFHHRFHGGSLLSSLFFTCYNFSVGLFFFSLLFFYYGFWGGCGSWCWPWGCC